LGKPKTQGGPFHRGMLIPLRIKQVKKFVGKEGEWKANNRCKKLAWHASPREGRKVKDGRLRSSCQGRATEPISQEKNRLKKIPGKQKKKSISKKK